jgi:hypothetical protein
MTQAKLRFANFLEYLAWSDDSENHLEGRFELIDGKWEVGSCSVATRITAE